MTWSGLSQDCKHFVCVYDMCQCMKKGTKIYGHLPAKLAEGIPWDTLCVDLIGPYMVTVDKKRDINRMLCTMPFIAPTTDWFEIAEIKNKTAVNILQKLETVWLSRYPRPGTL